MSRHEERQIVNEFRRKTVMGCAEKRTVIIELATEMSAASRRAPAAAAALLPRIWALRQRLDIGCLPVVCR
jgi:hypothetical protein